MLAIEINTIVCFLEYKNCGNGIPVTTFNPLTPELNPSAQRCQTRFVTGNFAS
jgi:hypothetical protein